jgi:tRNA/tmRNA/rRNA uracil-C5-methylase (TrmA/RlmC/RlmD family)
MRVAGSICAGLYAGFEENRKPDQPVDPCEILMPRYKLVFCRMAEMWDQARRSRYLQHDLS